MARGRSEKAHLGVLKAAAELFASKGIDATSMDAIADASGVSKATIYNHWPDKTALCMEVLSFVHRLGDRRPKFESPDFRGDLIALLTHEPPSQQSELAQRIWPHLIAYSAKNQEFGDAWRAKAMEPVRHAIADMLARGQRSGILRRGIDHELAFAMLLGPLIYRKVFLKRSGKPSPKNIEAHVVDAFLSIFATHNERKQR